MYFQNCLLVPPTPPTYPCCKGVSRRLANIHLSHGFFLPRNCVCLIPEGNKICYHINFSSFPISSVPFLITNQYNIPRSPFGFIIMTMDLFLVRTFVKHLGSEDAFHRQIFIEFLFIDSFIQQVLNEFYARYSSRYGEYNGSVRRQVPCQGKIITNI